MKSNKVLKTKYMMTANFVDKTYNGNPMNGDGTGFPFDEKFLPEKVKTIALFCDIKSQRWLAAFESKKETRCIACPLTWPKDDFLAKIYPIILHVGSVNPKLIIEDRLPKLKN